MCLLLSPLFSLAPALFPLEFLSTPALCRTVPRHAEAFVARMRITTGFPSFPCSRNIFENRIRVCVLASSDLWANAPSHIALMPSLVQPWPPLPQFLSPLTQTFSSGFRRGWTMSPASAPWLLSPPPANSRSLHPLF